MLDLREDLESVLFVPQLPDLKDAEAVQKFFLEEIQHGEELLAQGKAASRSFVRPRLKSSVLTVCTLVDRRLRERRGPPDQRHRGVRSASAAAAGAAADSAAARLPDAAHQTADHQPGTGPRDPHMSLIQISFSIVGGSAVLLLINTILN